MKRLIATIALLLVTSRLHAYEVPNNPDRYPSIGLQLQGGSLDLDYTQVEHASGLEGTDKFKGTKDISMATFEVIFPVSSALSLNFHVTGISNKLDDHALFIQNKVDESGRVYGIGAKWYIH